MGSSHQNVKQILLKPESKGFVNTVTDEKYIVPIVQYINTVGEGEA